MSETLVIAIVGSVCGLLGTGVGGAVIAYFTYVLPKREERLAAKEAAEIAAKKDKDLAFISDAGEFREQLLATIDKLEKKCERLEAKDAEQQQLIENQATQIHNLEREVIEYKEKLVQSHDELVAMKHEKNNHANDAKLHKLMLQQAEAKIGELNDQLKHANDTIAMSVVEIGRLETILRANGIDPKKESYAMSIPTVATPAIDPPPLVLQTTVSPSAEHTEQ